MSYNPSLYEINTRVWLRKFNDPGMTLDSVPDSCWLGLKEKGIDYIWLMGVWEICRSTIEKYCFEEFLIREYKAALKDYSKEDVIGSPYSIDSYELNSELGNEDSLPRLKEKLNSMGLKLILDFVPNHYSAETRHIETNPEVFLKVTKEHFMSDPYSYYKPDRVTDKYFAHGRDPFFPPWRDTIQINYFSIAAREFMVNTLKKISKAADGVRSDMSMLCLNNIFQNTWGSLLSDMGFRMPQDEFWSYAIAETKKEKPEFIFIAESYWDLEWELQQLGFDYTYDKKLTDRLETGFIDDIRGHLRAEYDFQNKSVRFIENHDEKRSLEIFGKDKAKTAAVIISTIPGMRFYFDGQWEGKRTKLPVQLARGPKEPVNEDISEFYNRLLEITRDYSMKGGEWELIELKSSWDGNNSYKKLLAWMWRYENEKRLVIVNISDEKCTALVDIDLEGYPEEFILKDLLNEKTYFRSAEEVHSQGLYVELKKFESHIFSW